MVAFKSAQLHPHSLHNLCSRLTISRRDTRSKVRGRRSPQFSYSADPLANLLHADNFFLECIDPRLLWIHRPADDTPIETPYAFSPDIDTHPDLKIFPPPTSAPATATHYDDDDYKAVTPVCYQFPPLSEASAQYARAIPSRGRNDRTRSQNLPPRYKKRRAKGLEVLAEQPFYHSLPTVDREYFDDVVTKLSNAFYLVSPQSLEPTVGSAAGRLLIGPRRLTGPGVVAARESVYAVLVDRPSEGAFVCWICGETRADRRLLRALDHVRGHFNHRPYHCSETHFDPRIEGTPVW